MTSGSASLNDRDARQTHHLPRRVRRAVTAVALVLILTLAAGCAGPANTVAESPGALPTAEADPAAHADPVAPPAQTAVVSVVAVQVMRVVDGDTAVVQMPDGTSEKVRFIGVDTPESTNEVETFGPEASAYTSTALTGRTVYLETDVELRDTYGRLLAHVWLEVPQQVTDETVRAHLFNAHLVLSGYANLMTIPPNVKYVDYLRTYESEARQRNAGLWSPVSIVPAAPSAPAPTTGSYIANRNTGKFHHSYCGSVDQMNPANKVPYATREQAVSAGYVPCKNCNP